MNSVIFVALLGAALCHVSCYQLEEDYEEDPRGLIDDLDEYTPSLVDDSDDYDLKERYHDPLWGSRFRFRRPRFPRIRTPRVRFRLPRVRVRPRFRLPRIRIRTPRLRKVLPRIRIPRLGRRLTPRLRIRLRRIKVPGIRIFIRRPKPTIPVPTQGKPNTPSPPQTCFLGTDNGCDKNWRKHDQYGFIDYFNASCVKFNVCRKCASLRGWKLSSCQEQFGKDMKDTVCKDIVDQFTKFVCVTQADKFYGFTKVKNSSLIKNSPNWCEYRCVADFAQPS